jgi:hypothetical protein
MRRIDDLRPTKKPRRRMSVTFQILAGAMVAGGFFVLIWLVTHAH